MYKTRTNPKSLVYGHFKHQSAVEHTPMASQPTRARADYPSISSDAIPTPHITGQNCTHSSFLNCFQLTALNVYFFIVGFNLDQFGTCNQSLIWDKLELV